MTTRHVSEPKGFQIAAVKLALNTLQDEDGPKRFLVADEVGLGKTVVARTIVSEMMQGRRSPLVVLYVASNLNIAHQNRRKLLEILATKEERDDAVAGADRLTIAAKPSNRPIHARLHLYTLTPATSAPLYRRRGGFGRLEERAILHRLLTGWFPSLADDSDVASAFRGKSAGLKSWKDLQEAYAEWDGIHDLQAAFIRAIESDQRLSIPLLNAESIRQSVSAPKLSRFMGALRNALALAVFRVLSPDLIIFDEFQKFRELLIDEPQKPGVPPTSTDELTKTFRGGTGRNCPALLLLSATPYRAYSSREDESAGLSHHQDFFELIHFLFGGTESGPAEIREKLERFGEQMCSEKPDFLALRNARDDIQRRLQCVLSRTERPGNDTQSSSRNTSHPHAAIRPEDLRVFKHWVSRLKAKKARRNKAVDPVTFAVPYWQSVPLPIQMLGRGYVAWRGAERKTRHRTEPTLRLVHRDRLKRPKVWPHPQLRALQQIAHPMRLALPWVAPSMAWWELGGPWARAENRSGKLLIFSRFKAVPPALASLLSFDLESSLAARLPSSYERVGKAQPLQLKANRPTLPALFFPAPTLIANIDPIRDRPTNLMEARASVRAQMRGLLKNLDIKIRRRQSYRPLWKLLPALEQMNSLKHPDKGFPTWSELKSLWLRAATGQADVMREVLSQWQPYAVDGLSSVSAQEVSDLAEFALSGPGVVLGRALYRFDKTVLAPKRYGDLLKASWSGLRPYLNRSLFHATLTRRGQTYMNAIPEAVVAGNLESVLDEHLWITSRIDADAIGDFCKNILEVFGLREGRHLVHEPGAGDKGFQLRCHAAMPFANAKVTNPVSGSEERLRTDDLRRSFNSPFWPHVLATTSLGQEGLDFHVWCKQLLHWDLCSSPIDLEQREGRIQRYGSLSVRTALADQYRDHALDGYEDQSPWSLLAGLAENAFTGDASGRSPWWSCPGEKIDRFFIVLPQSRQIHRFDELSRQRWLYRLALGQPHQQDFIETISQLPNDGRHNFALCLSAWRDAHDSDP